MPYIAHRLRVGLDTGNEVEEGPGQLNYSITKLINNYFHNNGGRYQQVNDILGALEGAKLEFYRRIAAPYEDMKIKENGDVY